MRNALILRVGLVLLAAHIVAPAAFAEGEIGVQGGVLHPDGNIALDGDDFSPTFGLRGAYRLAEDWAWFLDANYSIVDVSYSREDLDLWAYRTGVEYIFNRTSQRAEWFLSAGGGLMSASLENQDADRSFASLGLGRRYYTSGNNNWRWEFRGDYTIGNEGFESKDILNAYFLFGYNFGFGAGPGDADGDGVNDRRDKCPDTPRGATVDEKGCPKDSDGDGVYDGIDKCPGTEKGLVVDSKGCPKDSDGDGVFDGKDECPGTPKGATVDARGCPKDSDGDGVFDGIDRCPDTPKGATVDATGCPKDSDGDGVFDGIDKCPGTPKGATVDATGCPKDSDGDGVFDGIDKCPGTPKGTPVDAAGCPKLFPEGRKVLVLEGVNFETNRADITANSRSVLDKVAKDLKAWPEVKVEVGGHTDSTGRDSYNQSLSQRRAESVRAYLVAAGVNASQLSAKGYGETSPIASNETKAGRAKNRRVELKRLN